MTPEQEEQIRKDCTEWLEGPGYDLSWDELVAVRQAWFAAAEKYVGLADHRKEEVGRCFEYARLLGGPGEIIEGIRIAVMELLGEKKSDASGD